MYKSRRVLFSLFVNIPLTTPRINFRISECHHRFSIDLIIIFSAKNGKLFLDHTDPLNKTKPFGEFKHENKLAKVVRVLTLFLVHLFGHTWPTSGA